MLTHVKDHLTGEMIPVRHIEPGTETPLDDWDQLAALVATCNATNAELDAMAGGLIEEDAFEMGFDTIDRSCHVAATLDALLSQITVPNDNITAAPIRCALMPV